MRCDAVALASGSRNQCTSFWMKRKPSKLAAEPNSRETLAECLQFAILDMATFSQRLRLRRGEWIWPDPHPIHMSVNSCMHWHFTWTCDFNTLSLAVAMTCMYRWIIHISTGVSLSRKRITLASRLCDWRIEAPSQGAPGSKFPASLGLDDQPKWLEVRGSSAHRFGSHVHTGHLWWSDVQSGSHVHTRTVFTTSGPQV